MKELHGTAETSVTVPIERCFALLHAVETYPAWYPDVVRDVEVVEHDRDGSARQARAVLHVAAGPLVQDFKLLLAVSADPPREVNLTRIPHDRSDPEQFAVTWLLAGNGRTQIHLDLRANLSVPRFIPLGGLGDSLAHGFVDAAARALDEG